MAENPSRTQQAAYGLPPFDRIQNADYLPAFEQAMRAQRTEVQQIAQDPAEPDFQNTWSPWSAPGRC